MLLAQLIKGSSSFWGRLDKYLSPLLFLGLRIWIGMVFFKAGLQKLENWESTVQLFQYEYAVPLLPPVVAAYSATFFELVAAPLVMVGFLTRLSALPFLIMAIVIQLTYLQHEHHYAWAVVSLLLVLKGPGALSVDKLLECWCSKRCKK